MLPTFRVTSGETKCLIVMFLYIRSSFCAHGIGVDVGCSRGVFCPSLRGSLGLKRPKHARSQVLGLCTVWHKLRKNAKGVYVYYLFCRRPCSDFESDMCFATSIDFVMPPATDPRGNVTRRKQKWQRVAGPHNFGISDRAQS